MAANRQRSPVSSNRRFSRSTTTAGTTTMIPPQPSLKLPRFPTKFDKRLNISPDTLKDIFTKTRAERDTTETGKRTNKLLDLMKSRVADGRTNNLKNYRTYAAIDEAFDAPFNQPSAALVDKVLNGNLSEKEMLVQMASYGISEATLFTDVTMEVNKKKITVKQLNEQTFYKVLVPLVKSILTIRSAKLFNDRNQTPLFKYEPVVNTEENRMICEIITNLVSKVSHLMGFTAVMRETIMNALLYSTALVFPAEAWYHESDERKDAGGKVNEFSKKEGIRYHIPHPTRCGMDQQYRASTINTDTGVTYAYWWRIDRYGEIESNEKYYNKHIIPYGTNWFDTAVSGSYFKDIYPCKLNQPDYAFSGRDSVQRDLASANYKTNEYDTALFVTDFFMKLIPKQWGLGEWKHQVWFRFVIASDDTIIFAEPYPYCPLLYLGCDVIEGRARNSSLAMDIVPFQVHIGNILSQTILGAKQNLAKVVYYDTEIVDTDDINKIKAQSKDSSGILFVPFSSKKARTVQVGMQNVFMPLQFPLQNTAELTSTISTIINIMERLLGMSSSEVGAAGVHVQTAEEIRVISNNTTTRVEFTGSYVDEFIDAWKRQIYIAMSEYMDEEFVSEVAATSKEAIKRLSDLGFNLGTEPFDGKVQVRGKKKSLTVMEGFVASRDGANRINQPQIAQVMMQTIQAVAASPMLSQVVGAEQIIMGLNMAAQLAGAPRDWRLRPDVAQQQLVQVQQMLQNMGQQIAQTAVQESMKATKPLAQEVVKQGKAVEKITQANAAAQQAATQQAQQSAHFAQEIMKQVAYLQNLVGAALQSLPGSVAPRGVAVGA